MITVERLEHHDRSLLKIDNARCFDALRFLWVALKQTHDCTGETRRLAKPEKVQRRACRNRRAVTKSQSAASRRTRPVSSQAVRSVVRAARRRRLPVALVQDRRAGRTRGRRPARSTETSEESSPQEEV